MQWCASTWIRAVVETLNPDEARLVCGHLGCPATPDNVVGRRAHGWCVANPRQHYVQQPIHGDHVTWTNDRQRGRVRLQVPQFIHDLEDVTIRRAALREFRAFAALHDLYGPISGREVCVHGRAAWPTSHSTDPPRWSCRVRVRNRPTGPMASRRTCPIRTRRSMM